MKTSFDRLIGHVPLFFRNHVNELCIRGRWTEAATNLHLSGFPRYEAGDLRDAWCESYPALQPPAEPAPPPPADPNVSSAVTPPAPKPAPRKRRGKLARLPKVVRAEVNTMLDDGASYDAIIQRLAERGYIGFNCTNLHKWHYGGYLDWQNETERLDHLVLQREWLTKAMARTKPNELYPFIDHLFATQLMEGLFGLDTTTLKKELSRRPRDLVALFNSYHRMKRQTQPAQASDSDVKPDQT